MSVVQGMNCLLPIPDEADRLAEILDLHLHPCHGSRYWLRRQEELRWDICDRVRSFDDLWLLGRMRVEDLRRYPLDDFIPRTFHPLLHRFVIGGTAGTSGSPCAAAYRDDEFQEAFVAPFLRVVGASNFPRGQSWLWVGPSGPHIIGKVVRELARQTGSIDPFSVDFDPRWAKRLAEGSLARQRYLDHVTEQALDVLAREWVGVLFITPPALAALLPRMSDSERERIRGIHYGGVSMAAQTVNEFRIAFPNAVHLAGYGNTLFGVVMEVEDQPREALDYFPTGDRLRLQVVDWSEGDSTKWPPEVLPPGRRGRIVFDRLDESTLLIGVVERDEAECIAPSTLARKLGATYGLRNPRPAVTLQAQLQIGIY